MIQQQKELYSYNTMVLMVKCRFQSLRTGAIFDCEVAQRLEMMHIKVRDKNT